MVVSAVVVLVVLVVEPLVLHFVEEGVLLVFAACVVAAVVFRLVDGVVVLFSCWVVVMLVVVGCVADVVSAVVVTGTHAVAAFTSDSVSQGSVAIAWDVGVDERTGWNINRALPATA